MKKFVAVVVLLSTVAATGMAGDPSKPISKTGSKALLFDLTGLAVLSAGNYQGGIGGKYFVANGFAVRLALGAFSSATTTTNPAVPIPAIQLSESRYTSVGFSIVPGVQWNVAQSNAIQAYVGLQISYSRKVEERTGNASSFDLGFTKDNGYKKWENSFGAGALVGVEWFAWDNISLAGEYRLTFESRSGKTEGHSGSVVSGLEAPRNVTFGLGTGNAAGLTLSVYF